MFLDAFVREHLSHAYPGREFSVVQRAVDTDRGDYLVHEISGRGRDLQILRTARIDPRSVTLKPDMQCVRYIERQLDKAFDIRTDFEKLPWQMFSL